jgi:hypothetical protein
MADRLLYDNNAILNYFEGSYVQFSDEQVRHYFIAHSVLTESFQASPQELDFEKSLLGSAYLIDDWKSL